MLSFNSIAAVGSNAAIVHYNTDEGDDWTLTKEHVFLLDAGAQYEGCTTDVTRTHHFGNPLVKEKVRSLIMGFTNKFIYDN
jgi:Xaa-Pro aminopeptidase